MPSQPKNLPWFPGTDTLRGDRPRRYPIFPPWTTIRAVAKNEATTQATTKELPTMPELNPKLDPRLDAKLAAQIEDELNMKPERVQDPNISAQLLLTGKPLTN